MAESSDHIPFGDNLYLDMSKSVVAHYGVSDSSEVADECWEGCNPEELASFHGSQAAAKFCMMNAMRGGGQHEMLAELEVHCDGPKRRLLGGKKCGAKVTVREVALPIDPEDTQGDS